VHRDLIPPGGRIGGWRFDHLNKPFQEREDALLDLGEMVL
jgi:hypothetical protein